jgi:DNA helicase-2/ATP-dependent DNA helicase PcrA
VILGPPGTGKTTTLLKQLEESLSAGVYPEHIAFLTFTRRARREAVERVEKILGIDAQDLPHFRTIHSMAFKGLGLREGDVVGKAQLDEFGAKMGLTFGNAAVTEIAAEGVNSRELGDALLAIDNLARLRGHTVRKTWNAARADIEWHVQDHFSRSYTLYKRDTGLLDFTDVLSEYAKSGRRLDVHVAFIDEAQDLSALQWLAALQAVESAEHQYVSGDDDQSIFAWAGADSQVLIDLPGERRVLGHSYRLPRTIHALAVRIVARIHHRIEKEFDPRDAEGDVHRYAAGSVPTVREGESWLWLVRNRYLLASLKEVLEQRGVVYSQHGVSSIWDADREAIYDWERLQAGKPVSAARVRALYKRLPRGGVVHGQKALPGLADGTPLTLADLRAHHGLLTRGSWFDALSISPPRKSYYRALLRKHRTLRLTPQVQLETIHGAKGAEADHVALWLDQSKRVWEEMQIDPDAAHRVWYVAVTRARESLHLISASSPWGYPLPV